MPDKAKRHRFPILITSSARLLLLPLGVRPGRAFAEIRGEELRVVFGPLFDEKFPLADIEDAAASHWPLWAGIGPRANLRGNVGLVGAFSNIVELRLREPLHVRMFVMPLTCRKLFLSLVDPEAFLEALGKPPMMEETAKAA
jgi:hypothetical protein